MIRITQQNDWVIFVVLGCLFIYIFMLVSLRRDSSVAEFLMQKFPDSTNNFLTWLLTGIVFSVVLATLLSQFVPLLPQSVSSLHLFGFQLNKFGYSLLAIALFYVVKNVLTYVFFAGTGALKNWERFYFAASKLYFVFSLILMVMCIARYFYSNDPQEIFTLSVGGIAVSFVFKLLYYLFHPGAILPAKWYYKFLYICTLQIVPVLVLWKVLFI